MRAPFAVSTSCRLLIAVASLAGAAACGSDSSTGISANTVAGVYTLRTVDGVALPAPAKDERGVLAGTALDGSMTMTADGTFTAIINYTRTDGTPLANTGSGTYTVNGASRSIQSNGGDLQTASFSGGNTVTAQVNTQTYIFKK